jgi:hypothetical protein
MQELENILYETTISDRMRLFDNWRSKWVVEYNKEQPVLDRKYLSSEFEEELYYALATKLAEQLFHECIKTNIKDTSISLHLVALKKG